MSVLQMSFSASVLILAVMLVRMLVFRRLPKKFLMVLWGIVLLRLLFSFYIPIGDLSASPDFSESLLGSYGVHNPIGVNTTVTEFVHTLNARISNTLSEIVQHPFLIAIWFFGAVALALGFLVTHFRRRKEYDASLPVQNSFISKWLSELDIKRNIQVRISDRVNAPLTYGVWKPIILLPRNTDLNDETRLMHILTHEVTHIKHFDILIKWLLALALCVHWFNPLVWVMYILANQDIEFLCDESVVQTFGMDAKSTYALNLIGLEENKCINSPLVASFAKKPLEKRINAIMNIKKASVFGIMLAVLLILGTGVVMAATSVYSRVSHYNEMITMDYVYEKDDSITNKQYDGMVDFVYTNEPNLSNITTTRVFCCGYSSSRANHQTKNTARCCINC